MSGYFSGLGNNPSFFPSLASASGVSECELTLGEEATRRLQRDELLAPGVGGFGLWQGG